MPRDSSVAATPEGAKAGQEQPGTSSALESSTAVPETAAADILRYAGVPEEVVNALGSQEQQQAPPAPQPDTGKEEPQEPEPRAAESDAVGEDEGQPESEPDQESDQEPEDAEIAAEQAADQKAAAEADAAEEPEDGQHPSWFQKRVSKWKRKEERLQDEIDDLKDQLARKAETPEQQAPIAPQPDPFANVQTFEQLQQTVEAQRQVRDWCLENPDGLVLNEGKENERVVTPEEVRRTLIGATRLIEAAPRKAQELQARAQWSALARQDWPELFDPKSEIHQTAQQFLAQHPGIASSAARDFVLGLLVEGWKTYQPRMEARMKGVAQPDTNGSTNGSKLAQAIKRKIPPIPKTQAPNPPRGSRVPSPIKDAAAAVERVVAERASPESVQNAIAAIERQNAASGGARRTPAPV